MPFEPKDLNEATSEYWGKMKGEAGEVKHDETFVFDSADKSPAGEGAAEAEEAKD